MTTPELDDAQIRPIPPLKPNRRAGGFYIVWQGTLPIYWIDEQYHLYKDNAHLFTSRDAIELANMRQYHIERSDVIEIDNCKYVVWFQCEISDRKKLEIISRYHNGDTQMIEFAD